MEIASCTRFVLSILKHISYVNDVWYSLLYWLLARVMDFASKPILQNMKTASKIMELARWK